MKRPNNTPDHTLSDKLNMLGEEYKLGCEKEGGSFCRSKLIWRCQVGQVTDIFPAVRGSRVRVHIYGSESVLGLGSESGSLNQDLYQNLLIFNPK